MGFPIIKVSSVAGGASDTVCSGAGPATALTGTAARQRAGISNPLRIGLFGFTGSLAAVATDGTHAILFNDTTAGHRSHASIAAVRDVRDTGLANMTATSVALTLDGSPAAAFAVGDVIKITGAAAAGADLYTTIAVVYTDVSYDVSDAAGTTVSLATYECPKAVGITSGEIGIVVTADTAWAIGGTRASISGTLSRKLFENNSTLGDAMPGWIVRMLSAHTESMSATINLRRSGDTTNGEIVLEGEAGAATMPVVTMTVNANQFIIRTSVNYIRMSGFLMNNSSVTKTGTIGVNIENINVGIVLDGLLVGGTSAANSYAIGIAPASGATGRGIIRNCEVRYCSTAGISNKMSFIRLTGNRAHHNAIGIDAASGDIEDNLVYLNTGVGIKYSGANAISISGNTVNGNGGHGIEIASTSTNLFMYSTILANNIITNNTGYAVDFSGAGITDALLAASGFMDRSNLHYGNSSGYCNLAASYAVGLVNADPLFVNAAAGDFTLGASSPALGVAYPASIGLTTTQLSYGDIGAAQKQASAGGSVIIIED